MASQVPAKKNTAFNLGLCLYKNDGSLIANPATLTAKISKDFGDYADVGTVSDEDSTYGQVKLALTNTEMNADVVMLYVVDSTVGCVPFTQTIYTTANLLDDIKTDTAAILADTGTDGVIVGALNAAAVTDTEDAVWDALRSAHTDVGSFGDIDTTADVAGAVWDVDTADHDTAGTTGKAVADGGAAGDPWGVALPGEYGAGTAGKALSDVLADTGSDGVVLASDAITSSKIADNAFSSEHFADTYLARMGVVAYGVAHAYATTWLRLGAEWTFDTNALVGSVLVITSATTGVGQSRVVTASSDVVTLTVDTFSPSLTGDVSYVVVAAPPASATALPNVNVTQISGDETAANNLEAACDGTAYNIGGGSVVAASVTGNVGGSVGSVAANGITASSFATDSITSSKISPDVASEIADQVWNETLSEHVVSGSTGAGLTAAGAAGDPWSTAVPGAYGAGTAGYLIGSHINAPIGTVDTVVDAIKAKTDNLPASPAAVGSNMGLAAATIDAIHDEVVEGSTTFRELMRGVASALFGVVSGANGGASTITFSDLASSKTRITSEVDGSGNRISITLDLTE